MAIDKFVQKRNPRTARNYGEVDNEKEFNSEDDYDSEVDELRMYE